MDYVDEQMPSGCGNFAPIQHSFQEVEQKPIIEQMQTSHLPSESSSINPMEDKVEATKEFKPMPPILSSGEVKTEGLDSSPLGFEAFYGTEMEKLENQQKKKKKLQENKENPFEPKLSKKNATKRKMEEENSGDFSSSNDPFVRSEVFASSEENQKRDEELQMVVAAMDPNGPPHPYTHFDLFLRDIKDDVKFPSDRKEATVVLYGIWSKLQQKEKENYVRLANSDVLRYKRELGYYWNTLKLTALSSWIQSTINVPKDHYFVFKKSQQE